MTRDKNRADETIQDKMRGQNETRSGEEQNIRQKKKREERRKLEKDKNRGEETIQNERRSEKRQTKTR